MAAEETGEGHVPVTTAAEAAHDPRQRTIKFSKKERAFPPLSTAAFAACHLALLPLADARANDPATWVVVGAVAVLLVSIILVWMLDPGVVLPSMPSIDTEPPTASAVPSEEADSSGPVMHTTSEADTKANLSATKAMDTDAVVVDVSGLSTRGQHTPGSSPSSSIASAAVDADGRDAEHLATATERSPLAPRGAAAMAGNQTQTPPGSGTPAGDGTRLDRNGQVEKWCVTCKLWRPPGCVHCSTCGFCVRDYDHHCGVFSNCIGRRNHRFFVLALVSAAVGFVTLAVLLGKRVNHLRTETGRRIWSNPAWYFGVIVLVYVAYAGIAVGGFALGQVMLTALGRTEKEVLGHDRHNVRLCEHASRFPCNLAAFWCRPLGRGIYRSKHPFAADKGFLSCQ
eukprot:m.487680 g.487680  ORF g.487680 m.487680 type:complete len:398 (-) comp25197_c0_seq1:34-1227(-)